MCALNAVTALRVHWHAPGATFPSEFPGSFRNTTVIGAVTGLQLDLGVIDDPVKGRHEVSSRAIRNRTWEWFTDDFLSRFAADAGLLVIMTRWHIDDLLGRALEKFPDFQVLRYPAIAEDDEPHRKKGEALFPQFKPLEFYYLRSVCSRRHHGNCCISSILSSSAAASCRSKSLKFYYIWIAAKSSGRYVTGIRAAVTTRKQPSLQVA